MVFLVFGSLLPLVHDMQIRLEMKKERLAAYETLHEAAKIIASTGSTHGERSVNGILYLWQAEGHCVEYVDFQEKQVRLCIE
ncbi:hypothetical protein KQ939_06195 [Planococcus sp. CP5-4]|nr:hypothetical protein [Planococcus sp. CP5-4_YE]MBV0908543.1 hypothetical protein [Planococcus sp. CP5-4_UN]MBW6063312.1 hypothetical protein [Planococcus sp. CP5-4]